MDSHVVSINLTPTQSVFYRVKQQTQSTIDCGDKAAAWISKVIGKDNLRLHHSPSPLEKRLSHQVLKNWPTRVRKHDEVSQS